MVDTQSIIRFWFEETPSELWFKKDENFDRTIIKKFTAIFNAASKGELFTWRKEPLGRLAEIIVLDQFARNMFHGSAKSFANDPIALVLAQEAVGQNAHLALTDKQRPFLLMPYMHSESKLVHEEALKLFKAHAPGNLNFEIGHKNIIDRFSRYPHRNEVLGRTSTAEETAFLKEPGSSY